MKKVLRTTLSIVLVASLSLTSFVYVKSDKTSKLKKEKESVAAQKKKYKKKKSEAQAYLKTVDMQLTGVATEIYKTGNKLTKTEKEIKKTKKRLKKAKASVEVQNQDMQKRIQFMYENGDAEMLDMLPEKEQNFAYELMKKLVLAWDPDFTKLTPDEKKRLERNHSPYTI